MPLEAFTRGNHSSTGRSMRDMHCHILPGVDDGARDMNESLAMLKAAKSAGIGSIVCTPHCRDPYFDYDAMQEAFVAFKDKAGDFPLYMGFEVNHSKLTELGMDWAEKLGLEGSDEFLLELSSAAPSSKYREYERTIYNLQSLGYTVVIAHPERYRAIQKDIDIAQRLVEMGCLLQASCDFITGGRLGHGKKPAIKLFKAGLYTYIASDAHTPHHYKTLADAYSLCEKRGWELG